MASLAPELRPLGGVAGVGSLPPSSLDEALRFIGQWTPHFPNWPQLPALMASEGMALQFLPSGVLLDSSTPRIDIAKLSDLSSCSSTEVFQPAQIGHFCDLPWKAAIAVRGQVTGPATLCACFRSASGSVLAPDERRVVGHWIALSARNQALALSRLGLPVVVTVDEPMLDSRHGGADLAVPVFEAIREAGALAGLHCCADEDWDAVLGTRPDVLSFDASRFLERFLAARELDDALAGGLIVAWGAVPTDFDGDADWLAAGFAKRLHKRFGSRLRRVVEKSFVTPACGLGLCDPAAAGRVMSACHNVSAALRSEARLSN